MAATRLFTQRSFRWFVLVSFGVPWVGWTTVAVAGLGDSTLGTVLFYTGDFMTVGGFVATWIAAGRPGVASLWRRCLRVAVPAPWVLFALFLPFAWISMAILCFGLAHDGIGRINLAGVLTYVTGAGQLLAITTGPIGEEAGWRGYLLPRLLGRCSPIAASLLLGVLWSAWHYPLYYNEAFASLGGTARFTLDILCYSLLMTLLWAHTRGSVFWAVVFHWTINVTANVVADVFPEIRPPADAARWLTSAGLVLTTVALLGWIGPTRLRAKVAETRAALDAEAIDDDRLTRRPTEG